jgi:hypothetical protein
VSSKKTSLNFCENFCQVNAIFCALCEKIKKLNKMNKKFICCLSVIILAFVAVDAAIPPQNLQRKITNKGEDYCVLKIKS